jgi:choline dehydrogenase-like flavoprotein
VSTRCFDVCVIGAGPAGLASALSMANQGLHVALVESGAERPSSAAQRLADAEVLTPASQSAMSDAVCRAFGGTSRLWGGRCVPLDASDFEARTFVPSSGWPVSPRDLEPFYASAASFLGVGACDFAVDECTALPTKAEPLSEHLERLSGVASTQLERWSATPNAWQAHKDAITSHPGIALFGGSTCTGLRQGAGVDAVTAAELRPTPGHAAACGSINARAYVVACGGIESTRLVLNSMHDGLRVAAAPLVGRYYMGHPSGKIADIELSGSPKRTVFGFERDGDVYVRRRLTLAPHVKQQQKLLNIAFWLDNPPLQDWRHGNGLLSAAYLALTMPGLGRLLAPAGIRKRVAGGQAANRKRHLLNCLRSPFGTATQAAIFLYKRYGVRPALPGFFTYSHDNRYALHYHAEQAPNRDSAVSLSDDVDAVGMRRARISLAWSQLDVDSIIRAHSVLDAALQHAGAGRLTYRYRPEELGAAVREQAVDGFHQLGTLRMAACAEQGVTDAFGKIFGTANLYVASSAIFPTSGQANPTLPTVALAIRQAQHIARLLRRPAAE